MTGATLVLGAGGRLGSALANLPGCIGVPRVQCNITDPDDVALALDMHKPRHAINAAGYTDVDAAEVSDRCWAVNGRAVYDLVKACRMRGVALTHISSDYVLRPRGRAFIEGDDVVAPDYEGPDIGSFTSRYARSKAAGELAALQDGARVIRLQWLFSRDHRGFPFNAIAHILAGETADAVFDGFGIPTAVNAIAKPLLRLAREAPPGVYHLAPRGEPASPAEWLRAACEVQGIVPRIREVPRTSRRNHHLRPAWSVLDPSRAERFLGITMPDWRDALREELR